MGIMAKESFKEDSGDFVGVYREVFPGVRGSMGKNTKGLVENITSE